MEAAARLFTYLRELAKLRLSTVRDCNDYEEVLWFHEVPEEPECESIARSEDPENDDYWLRVQRFDEPRCDPLPQMCREWVDEKVLDDRSKTPVLREQIAVPSDITDEPAAIEKLSDHPEVVAAWREFVRDSWEPWAAEHGRWQTVQSVYDRLFAMHQMLKKSGESFEVILGLGLLGWNKEGGPRVLRHLLVGQANIQFDPHRAMITVGPSAEGIRLRLEQDMLDANEHPLKSQQEACQAEVARIAETPWPSRAVESPLKSYAHALNQRGAYSDALRAPKGDEIPAVPLVTFAPAVVLRKRTARSLVVLLDSIAKQIAELDVLPFGVRRLCEIVGDGPAETIENDFEERANGCDDDAVYFPLPSNQEQLRIVQRLTSSQGVLVQGPPGTGKSHTIANLICHLLATGKRVLVTSQTPRALKVLESKIPIELSALCVSVLGNDAGALKNLQNSVHGITDKQESWDADQNESKIKRLSKNLDQMRRRAALLENEIIQHREAETWKHGPVAWGAYGGTASEIAQQVAAAAQSYGWLTDAVQDNTPLPLAVTDFTTLLNALRQLPADRQREVRMALPQSEQTPDPATFMRAVEEERTAQAAVTSLAASKSSERCRKLQSAGSEIATTLVTALHQVQSATDAARQFQMPWVVPAMIAVFTGHDRSWWELYEKTSEALLGLIERARAAQGREVVLPDGHHFKGVLADARELHAHLASGGGLGFLVFRAAVVKRTGYITRTVRVNGRAAARVEVITELIEHLETQVRIEDLRTLWSEIQAFEARAPLRLVGELQSLHEALGAVLSIRKPIDAARSAIAGIPGLANPDWSDRAEIEALVADCEAAFARQRLASAISALQDWQSAFYEVSISPTAHPVARALAEAVKARDPHVYAAAHHEWQHLCSDADLLSRLSTWMRTLETAAPAFAQALGATFADSHWDARLTEIEAAWQWAGARTWLNGFLSRSNIEALEDEHCRIVEQQQESIAKLAAAKAWAHFFDRLSRDEGQSQHLRAWAQAIRRIGRGTGRRAEQHRRDAQQHLDACREAVPAWVMPFHRVAETIRAHPEAFDVIIVDEASQSGPETLALMYLGKKIVVVGDDEQISPEGVGVSRDAVASLADRYLIGIPHRDALDVTSSLFHQGAIRFGGRVVLREHFRCMPEIIRFSSDLCYRGQLEPLRQYPPNRLEPIIVRHVPGGYREGTSQSARNLPEAEMLADAISDCCRDPAYEGKTIGVISLQGEAQAKLINKLLLKRLSPEEIEEREIVCGDAYAFQGDERDIMFLSMVAANNAQFTARTKDSDRQRYNVAASRARDQVWLFHSVTPNDLNQEDMRYKLLAYYIDPIRQPSGDPDWSKCDSKFEHDVGRIIHEKRFRLIPQYEPFGPNSYRIDFVVEGASTRLAVECDGPHHDEPEQIKNDFARQRQLERCGWNFWRVGASAFYSNPKAAMESLWRKLASMGIEPLGTHRETVQIPSLSAPKAKEIRPMDVVRANLGSARMTQQELLPAGQPDLFTDEHRPPEPKQPLPSSDGTMDDESPAAVAAMLRNAGANVHRKDVLRRVIMAAIPRRNKIAIRDVCRLTMEALELSGIGNANNINEAIERMADEDLLMSSVIHVWRKPD